MSKADQKSANAKCSGIGALRIIEDNKGIRVTHVCLLSSRSHVRLDGPHKGVRTSTLYIYIFNNAKCLAHALESNCCLQHATFALISMLFP